MAKSASILWRPPFLTALAVFVFVAMLVLVGFRTETWFDYDSGHQRELLTVWGVTIRDKPLTHSLFASIEMDSGATCLTGKPDWHKGLSFPLFSQRSPDNREAMILAMMAECGTQAAMLNNQQAGALKKQFLRALASGGIPDAQRVVQTSQDLYLKKIEEERSSITNTLPLRRD